MRPKRRIARPLLAMFAAMSTAALAAACGGGGTTAASGKAPAGLVKAGWLSVCTDPEYAPMEYLDNADTLGFDPDGARALGELWGVRVAFLSTSFDGLIPALNAKRCDISWSALYLSPEREKVADGTPFMATGPALIVRTGDRSITAADDLSGKTVAVQLGGANELMLKDLSARFGEAGKPSITVQAYPKTSETVAAVVNGKADALIETDVAVAAMVGKSGRKLVAVPGIFSAKTKFGVFTRKGSELTPAVAKGVQQLVANGTLAGLARKYGLDPANLIAL